MPNEKNAHDNNGFVQHTTAYLNYNLYSLLNKQTDLNLAMTAFVMALVREVEIAEESHFYNSSEFDIFHFYFGKYCETYLII